MKRIVPWRALVDLVLPDICRVCGVTVNTRDGLHGICDTCLDQVKYRGKDGCRRCGIAYVGHVDSNHLCGTCLTRPPSYHGATSVCDYAEPVRGLLHRLKYQSDTSVLPSLATIVNRSEWADPARFDWIIPVPLYIGRLRSRGYNQAVLLARLLFGNRNERLNTFLLQRVRETAPQAGLDGGERRRNLRGAFSVERSELLVGRCICLVDDVLTTGATANACSTVLLKAGVCSVEVVTMAGVRVKR
ncbi:ComF family protein [Desulfopila sp. IMCC35008]|uniref:ComF family protein n=1 Tax=Desulfopila sp. IMCC35008 TaxID=2653858 RepID=UPI0013D55C23|nr:ComF family protein [Desulfopila sp. IMCC35008]